MNETSATRHTNIRRQDGVVVLKPRAHLIGGDETDELERLIDQFDAEQISGLVINLGAVGLMNSTAVSQLVRAHLKFTKRGAKAVLCGVDRKLENVFVVTKLSLVFEVCPDEDAAIAACRRPAK